MKHCPTCNKTYTDQNLSFCIDDGTPLASLPGTSDEATVVSSSPGQQASDDQTGTYSDSTAPAYQAPGAYVPPGGASKRRVWPWVAGILAVLVIGIVGLGIVAAIVVPNMLRSASNRNGATYNSNSPRSENSNLDPNSNTSIADPGNVNDNTNSSAEGVKALPADEGDVLAVLTDLEHEWMVANINADKKTLDRVLADDFVATNPDGTTIGKAEYINTIQRDTTTEKWDFQDLKLVLKGNRATLSGVVRFQTKGKESPFRFTDKFVWRDGRWQATSAEIDPIEERTV